jgi:hypothetical protein
MGVVLTGANADGAKGALLLSQVGAPVIVQDPASAESPICPAAALARAPRANVLGLTKIAAHLVASCGQGGAETGAVAGTVARGPMGAVNRTNPAAARRDAGRKCRL